MSFSEKYVQISKQEYIQLKRDLHYHRSRYEWLKAATEELEKEAEELEKSLRRAKMRKLRLENQLYRRKGEKRTARKWRAANTNGAA